MKTRLQTLITLAAIVAPSMLMAGTQEGFEWTPWIDRDNPSGVGDFETIADQYAAGNVCQHPVAIQCREASSGDPWWTTDDVYHCDLRSKDGTAAGGVCVNSEQTTGDGTCEDYEARYLCPAGWNDKTVSVDSAREQDGSQTAGLTFVKRNHYAEFGVDQVGCPDCDPYQGDALCSEPYPILCIKVDAAQTNPGLTTDYYHGWTSGTFAPTLPIQGSRIGSLSQANALCERSFGEGYRMAEFHDGNGGWNLYGYGDLSVDRFWVYVEGQPNGNCFPQGE